MRAQDLTKTALVLGLILPTLSSAFAAKGGDSGGGGDALEGRVNEIRADLQTWIKNGGAKELTLPADISYGEYVDKMTNILENKKVALSFTYDSVKINGVEKTCRGAFVVTKTLLSEKKSNPQILCNITRFKDTEESKQYSLIHHEYAGLVNIEKNDGSASDYEVSNQLTDFLEDKIVRKLAVKKKPETKAENNTTLGRIIIKTEGTFKKEETITECHPFYDQIEKELSMKIDEKIIETNDLMIKEYYEKNGLTKVVDTKVISKTVKQNIEEKTIEIVFNFGVNAGADSTVLKFIMTIQGDYKKYYTGDITNYVDKTGRVKNRELACSISNTYQVYNSHGDSAPVPSIDTKLINAESGYQLTQEANIDFIYKTIYETKSEMKKELN